MALIRLTHRAEDAFTAAALGLMATLPALEAALRGLFTIGIPGSGAYVQHLVLWVAYLGAMLAAREGRHLDLAAGARLLPPWLHPIARGLCVVISTTACATLAWAAAQMVWADMDDVLRIGGWLPLALAEAILPISFVVIAARFVAETPGVAWRLAALAAPVALAAAVLWCEVDAAPFVWPGCLLLLAAAVLGAPIFIALGGIAALLFAAAHVPVAAIPAEAYRIIAAPSIPTIPLFTFAGYLLAESQASARLVHLFRACFAWLPGGAAIATTMVCAFFSTFTGASGVTILALGGLLLPVLVQSGYRERFALGLVTATGAIGMLFPPSLAVILYGVVAHVAIPDLFIAGIVPGLLMVGAVCAYGVATGLDVHAARPRFNARDAMSALWAAKWELSVPVVALFGIFGGFSTLTESAAITVVYVLFVTAAVHRDIGLVRDLPRILTHSSILVGGVFIILGVAMGLTNYLVDAEIPSRAAAWAQENLRSPVLFLIALNIFLLIVGCLDGFSAIIIAVPLVAPISAAFGIHPLHLAMIFLVNLELGYLLPPLGMNLFLASYRFHRPLPTIARATAPFVVVLGVVLLLVTYIPAIIIGVP